MTYMQIKLSKTLFWVFSSHFIFDFHSLPPCRANNLNLIEWAADSPISYWYLGGQYLGQPTSVDEPKIGRETLAILFSYPVSSAWTHVSTKDTCATKMRLSQQWLFPCFNRKEYCMPRTKDLPKTDKLMQKVYEILFSVYDFIWIC